LAAHRRELRQWGRTALAIGLLFASLPVAGRILFGVWEFYEAAAIGVICLVIAAYLLMASRGRTIPDGAVMLERARVLTGRGKTAKAIGVLTQALRRDPKFWQAFEYRGRLRLSEGNYAGALDDFGEAIRLAPEEQHLYQLRAQVNSLMVREEPDAEPHPGPYGT
jgi:tetratricopeptide (TPR) repeat protein